MPQIPRDSAPDSTLALLAEGYAFIPNRHRRHGSDIFETRLMLRKAVCIQGEEAARVFYEPGRFTRRGAMPASTLRLLQDKGSVATLDGEAHRWRKRMFMSPMTPEGIQRLSDGMAGQWQDHLRRWEGMERVVLHDEVRDILCRAVCRWAGIPLPEAEARRRTREIGAMIDGAGTVGPRNWYGTLLRARTERWLREVVERLRRGALEAPGTSAIQVFARHRDLEGKPLDAAVVAVELLNLLRPTVAVARFVTFAALALHEHPACRRTPLGGGADHLDLFVQEVRRFYPFFPFVAGRALEEFEWRGHRFANGDRVLLDLYGTNHDGRSWEEPDAFRPERFRRWDRSAFGFIPQGGGDFLANHRCAGEWITIELVKRAVRLLTGAMHYEVAPDQDLRIDLSRIPALPRSGFVITRVGRGAAGAAPPEPDMDDGGNAA